MENSLAREQELIVDLGLLKCLLDFPEALLDGHCQGTKQSLVSLYAYSLVHKMKFGYHDLFGQLDRFNLPKSVVHHIKKALYGPLGNPAWPLFNTDPKRTLQLIADLETYAKSIKVEKPKSLKSLMKNFMKKHPIYGSVEDEAKALGLDVEVVRERRKANCILFSVNGVYDPKTNIRGNRPNANLQGDVLTALMMIQAASLPPTKKERIAAAKEKDPTVKATDFPTDDYKIHRPEALIYLTALRGLAGTCRVKSDIFLEMVEMHSQAGMTNFLPFAPLFLQWFAHSPSNLHIPSINQLASLFGEYSGGTCHFMGELATRMRDGFIVEWKTLDLTLGKLCKRKEVLPNVTLKDEEANDILANHELKVVTDVDGVRSGWDLGWHVIGCHLVGKTNVFLSQIKDSIKNTNIKYNKIEKKCESLVFQTPASKRRLNWWVRRQGKTDVVISVLSTQVIAARRLPPLHVIETNPYTVLPSLTRSLRLESPSVERSEFFISGTHKEELKKKHSVREQRQEVQKELKNKEIVKAMQFKAMDDKLLIDAIKNKYERVADSELLNQLGIFDIKYEFNSLEVFFEELIKRHLGIPFPKLVGFQEEHKIENPLRFRYRLGDEEVAAAESWFDAVMDRWNEDSKASPTKATISVKRVWAAMSLIRVAMHLKDEGAEFSIDEARNFHALQRFSFSNEDERGVFALIPQLYWMYGIKKKDLFRKNITFLTTKRLLVPTIKISDKERWQDDFGDEILSGARFSSQSLVDEFLWTPNEILKRICDRMGISYQTYKVEDVFKGSPSKEKEQCWKILRKAVIQLEDRLSNPNLAIFASYLTKGEILESQAIQKYAEYKKQLKGWYLKIVEPLKKWQKIDDDTWVEDIDEDDLIHV